MYRLGEVAHQAVRDIGEELELQSGVGGSVLGGAEKAGRRWVWANQWDDPAVNHTSDWESVGDARCLM